MKIENKTVFITGSARGIGQSTAITFAQKGCSVIGCDLALDTQNETQEKVEAVGGEYFALSGDLSDPLIAEKTVNLATTIQTRNGLGFDILINNAGIVTSGTYHETDFENWQKTIAINLLGTMAVTHTALPHLLSKADAHIVNISSIAGVSGSPGSAAYTASKFGVLGFSKSLEYELMKTSVGLSTIHPTMVKTRMIQGVATMPLVPVIEPKDVVTAIMKAIQGNKPQVFVPSSMRLRFDILPRLFPNLTKYIIGRDKRMRAWQNAKKNMPEI